MRRAGPVGVERDDRVVQGGRPIRDIHSTAEAAELAGLVVVGDGAVDGRQRARIFVDAGADPLGRVARDGAVGDGQRAAVFVQPAAGADEGCRKAGAVAREGAVQDRQCTGVCKDAAACLGGCSCPKACCR